MHLSFTTPRLLLRQYARGDGDAVWQVIRRPEIYATTAYIPQTYPRPRVDWWFGMISSAIRNRTGYELGMFDRKTGQYIGNVGIINVRREMHSASVAYFVDPKKWGQGYATEGCNAMLRFAFEELGLFRVAGTCMAHNPASRRVMEKLGFSFEGVARAELFKDGRYIDVVHMAILLDEWERRNRSSRPM